MTQAALVKWPLLVVVIAIFGLAGFSLLSASSDSAAPPRLEGALRAAFRALAILCIVLSPVTLLYEAAAMANVSMAAAFTLVPEVALRTHVGRLWLWRAPFEIAVVVAAFAPLKAPIPRRALLLLSGVLLFILSLATHAIDKGPAAVAAQFVHEAAAALWFGALAGVCLAGFALDRCDPRPPGASNRWLAALMPRVSRLAGWCVAVIAVTGVYNAYREIGLSLDRLIYSDYGLTLIYKVLTVGVVVCIGGYNRQRLVPQCQDRASMSALIRNVAIETVLLICVLGWSALLANSPPPH